MKFGVRQICNVVFKTKSSRKIGNMDFKVGQPVLYIDTAKTSSMEQSTTTSYATGGRGNARLAAWEGQKTMTFTVEDAMISPMGLAVLSGAGLIDKENGSTEASVAAKMHIHMTTLATFKDGEIDLSGALSGGTLCKTAPIFVMKVDSDGSLTGKMITGFKVNVDKLEKASSSTTISGISDGDAVFVDYYVTKDSDKIKEINIAAEDFGGSYYVEADTLFRDTNGKDWPANITFPNVKIQSNFTFNMSSTGDPSTFTFTMDAFPDYTYFNHVNKVICVIQVIDNKADDENYRLPVMEHPSNGGFAKDTDNPAKTDSTQSDSYDDTVA